MRRVVDPAPDPIGNHIVHRYLVEGSVGAIEASPVGFVRRKGRGNVNMRRTGTP